MQEISALSHVLPWTDTARYIAALVCNVSSIYREKSLRAADESYRRAKLTVTALGKTFRLVNPDLGLVREIYGRQVYFPTPEWVPKPGDSVIDLGANRGIFAVLCGCLGARVIAVEAQSEFLPVAEETLRESGCKCHVKLVHGVIGATTGCLANTQRRAQASHWGRVPPEITMRDILPLCTAGKADFLKVDIEGSEFALFQGDADWLGKVQRISMEVHPQFGNPAIIQEQLSSHGFRSWLVPNRRDRDKIRTFPGHCYAEK